MRTLIVAIMCVLGIAFDAIADLYTLHSPNQRLQIQVTVSERDGSLHWAVAYDEREVLNTSALWLELQDEPALQKGFKVLSANESRNDSYWKPVYGERAQIRDHYNQVAIMLRDKRKRQVQMIFRAYDEGAALAYSFPEQKQLKQFTITKEHTEFAFGSAYLCHPVYSAQGEYLEAVPLSEVKSGCERPLTVQLADDLYAAIGEARLVDYARMLLRPVTDKDFTLESHLTGSVDLEAPYTTPWRTIMVANSPGQLLENNDFILNLNDPCAIKDTSWIRPGKVIRDVTLSTKGSKACIDFAVEHNLQYVELDAGWYGPENDDASDATTITKNFKKSGNQDPLNLHEIIRYGEERGIGIMVYVNRRALETQLDDILPLYKEWGIKGIKYGFVQIGSQRWTTWLHEAIRKAAKYEMLVDVHDEYRPTGYSRTYPNFMTQEGIRGNEEMPPALHNVTLPFTRYLCGAGDYTICWYAQRVKNTLAHQLGALIAFYSPLQFVFWYDQPKAYTGESGVELFDHVPTVWDDTKVLHGKIGSYASIARKSGDDWFVGTLNAGEERTLPIPLEFLDRGKTYTAYIYSDGAPDGSIRTAVNTATRTVRPGDTLQAHMAANGGHALRLRLDQ